jgi:hypothetical protein
LKRWHFKPIIQQLQKTIHRHDVQLFQDEPVQTALTPEFWSVVAQHDNQENVPGGHHSTKRMQGQKHSLSE